MKKLIVGCIFWAMISAPALANITILNENPGALYTYTLYDFTTNETILGTNFSIPYDVWQTNFASGTPTNAGVTLTNVPPLNMAGWYDGGQILPDFIHGLTAEIQFTIPNLYYPNYYKLLQVEIVYQPREFGTGNLTAFTISVPGMSEMDLVQWPEVRPGYWQDVTFTLSILPQPEWEGIWLKFISDKGIDIDSVEIATVCLPIPAPGAVILGGIGTVLVGWLRRRRCI